MVTDLVLAPLVALATWIVGLLPEGADWTLPGLTEVAMWLARVNSLVPIGGIVAIALGVLSWVVAFATVRAALTIWHIVWP